jgi:F-type H+-transporting ATPase subunit delta
VAELATTARPYARAAFASAGASTSVADWSTFIGRAAAAVQDAQVQPLIGNPRVPLSELVDLLQQIASGGKPTATPPTATPPAVTPALATQQRNFLQLLADNRRLNLLPEIAAQFEVLRAQAERIADVEVIAARELGSEQATRLQAALERRLGLAVRLHAQVDPALIGGAIVRYGDFVVDGSLRGRIERLGAAMAGA